MENFIRDSLVKEVLYHPKILVKDDIDYKTGERNIYFKADNKDYLITVKFDSKKKKWKYKVYYDGLILDLESIYILYAVLNSNKQLNISFT